MLDFDGLLEKIGPYGRYQHLMYILIGITACTAGAQTLLSVYLFATPDHWCHVPELANLSIEEQRLLSAPPGELTGFPADDSCHILDVNYSMVYERYIQNISTHKPNVSDIRECRQWQYEMELYGPTATTEWDLVCGKSALTSIGSSTYMLGFLLGVTLYGYLSDRVGRKPTWMLGLVIGTVLTSIASFMPGYWSFVIVRMLGSINISGGYTVGFVLSMEMIGKEKRVIPGVMYQGWFALGYMSLGGFAYLIKNYVWLNFTIAIIPSLFIGFWWVVPESARWLLSTGRLESAKLEIHRMGKMNRVPADDTLMAFETFLVEEAKKAVDTDRRYNMIDLVKTPRMRSRTFNAIFNWFVNSMVFYGISLGVTDLAGDPYINMVISGLSEFVGLVIAILMLNKLGRRWPLCVMMVFGGVCCLAINFLPPHLKILGTVLAMLGKFGIAGSFAIIYVFTAEMFPTVIRTIAVGSGSMGGRVGGLLAPFISVLGLEVWGPLPMLIFGGTSLLAGCLALLFPETLHQKLPETIAEGETFGMHNKTNIFSLPKKNTHVALEPVV